MNFEFIIPVAFFLVVAYILREFWLYRLRRALIEKGNVDENVKILADTSAGNDPLNSIKWGMVLAGIGVALLLGRWFPQQFSDEGTLGLMFLFAGFGFLTYYLIARQRENS